MDDRWLWGALALVLIVVAVVLLLPRSAQPAEALPPTPVLAQAAGELAVYTSGAVSAPQPTSPIPLVDAIGADDLSKVPRYPEAKALESQRQAAFGISGAKYIVADPPTDVGAFYMQYYNRKHYRVDETSLLSSDGTGWWGNFTSPDGRTSVAVFAISKWIDFPPGGPENPTTITVVKTDGDDLDVEALFKELGLDRDLVEPTPDQ